MNQFSIMNCLMMILLFIGVTERLLIAIVFVVEVSWLLLDACFKVNLFLFLIHLVLRPCLLKLLIVNAVCIFMVCIYLLEVVLNIMKQLHHPYIIFFNFVKTKPNDIILIVGDFNLPLVHWIFDEELNNKVLFPLNINSETILHLLESLTYNALYQLNNIRNVHNNDFLISCFATFILMFFYNHCQVT